MAQPLDLLLDPHRATITIAEAARILGVSKSTAHNAQKETGFLMAGVQVLRVGRRCVVSTAHLRELLGIVLPTPESE